MTYRLNNSVIRDPEGKVKYQRFRPGGLEHYHIGIWVEGEPGELDRIERVEYVLHPTFQKRIRNSSQRSNNFSVTFWSWGTFEVEARLYLVGGAEPIAVRHELVYDLPPDDAENYVDVGTV